jgi:hypothetical protein
VDISWSGLAAGSYLGAVSHTGDVGLMGLTLVEVEVAGSGDGQSSATTNGAHAGSMAIFLPMTNR